MTLAVEALENRRLRAELDDLFATFDASVPIIKPNLAFLIPLIGLTGLGLYGFPSFCVVCRHPLWGLYNVGCVAVVCPRQGAGTYG